MNPAQCDKETIKAAFESYFSCSAFGIMFDKTIDKVFGQAFRRYNFIATNRRIYQRHYDRQTQFKFICVAAPKHRIINPHCALVLIWSAFVAQTLLESWMLICMQMSPVMGSAVVIMFFLRYGNCSALYGRLILCWKFNLLGSCCVLQSKQAPKVMQYLFTNLMYARARKLCNVVKLISSEQSLAKLFAHFFYLSNACFKC